MKCDAVLVLFTRYPVAGEAKTRLIPALGAAAAAALQRAMTEHVLENAPPPGMAVEVRYTGEDENQLRTWLGPRWGYAPQGDGDLGARMARAVEAHFAAGRERVVLVGADCPETDSGVTAAAFAALRQHDVVIGPAADGGYYLIGVHRRVGEEKVARLFAETAWGTDTVCATTEARAADLGLRVKLLAERRDVDDAADLAVWEAAERRARISVIVPVLNEAAQIESVLRRVMEAPNVEVIVADGGSEDGTVAIAEGLGARVVKSARGRAAQMNAGATAAEGGILFFLHADTRLPEHWSGQVRQCLGQGGVVAGAFRFTLDAAGWRYRYVEWTTGLRCRFCSMPYGDQGLFLRRETFESLGGFPLLPVMEDYALVRALKQRGRVVTLDASVITSARRWQEHGVLNVTGRNVVAFFAYPLGVDIGRIARWLGRG